MQTGQAPIGERLLSAHQNENILFGVDSVPFLASSFEASDKLWGASKGTLTEILADQNLVLLYGVPWPPQGLYFKKEINSVADMAGIKFRAYNAATPEPLWAVTALGWAPLALMPFALMSLVIGVPSPNPSLAGMEGRFRGEIQALGIFRVTRHPVQTGIALWALGHLLANGDTASIWFFGAMLALAVGGAVSLDRRKARDKGEAWRAFASTTSLLPFAAILRGRNTFRGGEIGLWRPGLALAIYAILIAFHADLFGAMPY